MTLCCFSNQVNQKPAGILTIIRWCCCKKTVIPRLWQIQVRRFHAVHALSVFFKQKNAAVLTALRLSQLGNLCKSVGKRTEILNNLAYRTTGSLSLLQPQSYTCKWPVLYKLPYWYDWFVALVRFYYEFSCLFLHVGQQKLSKLNFCSPRLSRRTG